MKNLKRTLAALALALCGVAAYAGSGPGVTVLLRDGGKTSFAFAVKPVMSFAGDGLKISATGQDEVSYLIADVQRFYFEDDINAGISAVAGGSAHAVIAYSGGTLSVTGLAGGAKVGVFTSDGKCAATGEAGADGSASLSLGGLPSGVYVVSAPGCAGFKLVKK